MKRDESQFPSYFYLHENKAKRAAGNRAKRSMWLASRGSATPEWILGKGWSLSSINKRIYTRLITQTSFRYFPRYLENLHRVFAQCAHARKCLCSQKREATEFLSVSRCFTYPPALLNSGHKNISYRKLYAVNRCRTRQTARTPHSDTDIPHMNLVVESAVRTCAYTHAPVSSARSEKTASVTLGGVLATQVEESSCSGFLIQFETSHSPLHESRYSDSLFQFMTYKFASST